jgi:hypothetical protein
MRSGDILLFKAEKNFISKLIAWGTDSEYSHVAVCISPALDLAIEAITRGGVRARSIRKIPVPYDIYRVKEDYSYDRDKMTAYLINQLNNRYDYLGVLYLAILKLISKIIKPVKQTANKWQKDRDYFCSELCYEAFDFAGLDIVPEVPESDVTSPGDIAKSDIVESVDINGEG